MSRGGGTPLKVSEVAGLIDQIEAGGGSNPFESEYLSSDVEGMLTVYSVMDGNLSKSFKLTVNIPEAAQQNYYLFCFSKSLNVSCSEENFAPQVSLGSNPVNKEYNFTVEGTDLAPILVFVVCDYFNPFRPLTPDTFKAMLAIPVCNS